MVKRPKVVNKPNTPPPAAEAWVNNGGIDPELSKSESANKPESEPGGEQEKGRKYPHRISFDMDTQQYKRLKRGAFEEERPMNEILREAIEDWLKARGY